MTVAIKESLSILNQYLGDLEHTALQAQDNAQKNVERATKSAKKKSPPDLFTVPAGQQSSGADVDTKALASRLDGAIAKVERLLKEGA